MGGGIEQINLIIISPSFLVGDDCLSQIKIKIFLCCKKARYNERLHQYGNFPLAFDAETVDSLEVCNLEIKDSRMVFC